MTRYEHTDFNTEVNGSQQIFIICVKSFGNLLLKQKLRSASLTQSKW